MSQSGILYYLLKKFHPTLLWRFCLEVYILIILKKSVQIIIYWTGAWLDILKDELTNKLSRLVLCYGNHSCDVQLIVRCCVPVCCSIFIGGVRCNALLDYSFSTYYSVLSVFELVCTVFLSHIVVIEPVFSTLTYTGVLSIHKTRFNAQLFLKNSCISQEYGSCYLPSVSTYVDDFFLLL